MKDTMTLDNVGAAQRLERVEMEDGSFYKIAGSDAIRPFFMSIVSDSNHWMFISSNGGLSAGRKNSEHALFPYYTDDKITESAEITGSKSIFRLEINGGIQLWEPFSIRQTDGGNTTRNLYKSIYGNSVIFEEINHDLGLAFRYQWSSSNEYGFVRKSTLHNLNSYPVQVSLLDGIQNIIPHGVGSELQNRASNLVDAYKRTELHPASGLGIFALSAIIVDKAEPSEALKANVVWSLGLDQAKHLLSSLQLNRFRQGQPIQGETDVKGEKGAYFLHKDIELPAKSGQSWHIIANVNQNHATVAQLIRDIQQDEKLAQRVTDDIALGTKRLVGLVAASDGLQHTDHELRDARHFSNVMFNIMRGGIFDHNYQMEKWDFQHYLSLANKTITQSHQAQLATLPEVFTLSELKQLTDRSEDPDFQRLCVEYLPLKFSRRHGDPSRPWNRFSINTRSEVDGSKILDYEGNWRDIFQNWEALAHAYPNFMEGMILKFVNASTFDGYNPYRVTKGGFDWETIEPDDPWSYIGYWGDHQIIYLLKFLEFLEDHRPGTLAQYFDKDFFVYANVPYKIKPYTEILDNPKDTIIFDHDADIAIRERRDKIGADGALLTNEKGEIHRVNLMEKLLAMALAKMSNFIPEGGIWMNTQRPEWNDANNALVGQGVSMVTLYYLRRFFHFMDGLLANTSQERFRLSNELMDFYKRIREVLKENHGLLQGSFNDKQRKEVLDELGEAASEFREHIYEQSFWGPKRTVSLDGLRQFVRMGLDFLEHSIRANQRKDGMYHAYNLMTVENSQEVSISHLSEMLEGQVAALSSGYLSAEKTLEALDGMKGSALFREDQYSYLLYPNKNLPGFLAKNHIPKEAMEQSSLVRQLLADGQLGLVEQDVNGDYHFNGNFKNANDLDEALSALADTQYGNLAQKERKQLLQVFEQVFNHKEFTGRSGTFFGYEGLGSIYWHMVSKLQLAVQECCLKAIHTQESPEVVGRLLEHYYEINEGIGVDKSPKLYGAFPTDPYSHTPAGKGAQQPGMTGQVKEDILSRFGELGVFVKEGCLRFYPCLLRHTEFLDEESTLNYLDVDAKERSIALPENALAFTYCQVPVIYEVSDSRSIRVDFASGESQTLEGMALDKETSAAIFKRSGKVRQLCVRVVHDDLK